MPTFFNLRQYDESVREHIAAVFSGRSISEAAHGELSELFTDASWQTLGLPLDIQNSFVERNDRSIAGEDRREMADAWAPLFETLRHVAKEEELFIAMPLHSYPGWLGGRGRKRSEPDETRAVAAACRFDRAEFYSAEREVHFLTYEEFVTFGRSRKWGMVTHWQSFTILGAEAELIAAYVEAAGGLDAVRRRFQDCLSSQLRSQEGHYPEDRFADRITRALRWPPL